MKEVIQQILEEEKIAEARVEEARNKAKTIRLEAEEKARALVEKTKEQAQSDIKRKMAESEQEAVKEKENTLNKAGRKMEEFLQNKKPLIQSTVEQLLEIVLQKEMK